MLPVNTTVADPFGTRAFLKPLDFDWAWRAYEIQNEVHWLPKEVPMGEDIRDWNTKLNLKEKNLLTQIFRFFTQGDVDVGAAYYSRYLPMFTLPELRMMMGAFANMEGVHVAAYSLILEELGFPEAEHQAFASIREMADKHDFVTGGFEDLLEGFSDVQRTALEIAVFSAFTEGLHLFSSFAILLNFTRFGKMKGMGQIITWSVRDESLHVQSMIRLYRAITARYPAILTPAFRRVLRMICERMVELEDRFVDLAFAEGGIEGLTAADVKLYTRFLADLRMTQLGEEPVYGVSEHPLPWLVGLLSGVEHANFFESRSTEYSKAAMKGRWRGDVWGALKRGDAGLQPVAAG